ncbi:putative Transcription factor E3 [Glarea lozoyensis 74030]|uniref:Putative Transcription factor E3 n=1 Tax=Glarea lozoyensis (strain ATCC 74030 / MF5533) TaxID=1104152 RepID=H0EGF5_GLAL7|nr:putative Transcription factor E3 [Glarea lozoyensis 74030]
MSLGSGDGSFPTPIRTPVHRHQKTLSGQWDQANSLNSYNGSEFSSPIQGVHPNPQISDILKTGSMPAKLNNLHQTSSAPALQSQEMKRRRRRESHNLVERRRRDNINERIQELSHLVPLHRLEDEKVRKALQNNSPLSPTLAGLSQPPGLSPPQATSGLVPPGARRATAGNITTGIPIEEKDKGPNKGDILNGAPPFQESEEEQRMRTELMDAMVKNDGSKFQYSRGPGTGLRVPKHTDVKGDPLGASNGQNDTSLSPDNHSSGGDMVNQYWSGHNSGGSGPGSISFKEEDEYMDLAQ